MGCEARTSGIYSVNFDPGIQGTDCRDFNEFVDRIAGLPMASRYQAMAERGLCCVDAVSNWQKLQRPFSEYLLGLQMFLFDQEVKDNFGLSETGQAMLKVQIPRSNNVVLVADVAGYLFGFSYEQMLIAAGPLDYVTNQVTQHYSQRYPGLRVTSR